MAEAALRAHATEKGLDISVDSAGTGDWHIGHPPDPRAQAVAERRGNIDIGTLKARQVSTADFYSFDHIIAMDRNNLRTLQGMAPPNGKAQLSILLDHAPGQSGQSVPDPYYEDEAAFEHVWRLVKQAVENLAEKIG